MVNAMKQKSAPRKEVKNKPTLVAFLLDRSGSMENCKQETIKGFNGYIDTLRDKKAESVVLTLTQFDTIGIDILHDAVSLKSVAKLNDESYEPRGGTPLYDAMGQTIRATEKSAGSKFKVLFVTLTDGQENSSAEWNEQTIKSLIRQKEENDHWTFVHIGVGANGWDAVQRVAVGTRSFSNVLKIDPKDTKKTYARMGQMTANYMCDTSNLTRSATNVWKSTESDE